jgi:hypothetical protein
MDTAQPDSQRASEPESQRARGPEGQTARQPAFRVGTQHRMNPSGPTAPAGYYSSHETALQSYYLVAYDAEVSGELVAAEMSVDITRHPAKPLS